MLRPARLVQTYSRLNQYACLNQRRTFIKAFRRRQQPNPLLDAQTVKIRRKWGSKRAATILLYTGAVGLYLRWLLADVTLTVETIEEEEEEEEDEEEDDEDDEDQQKQEQGQGDERGDTDKAAVPFEGDEDALFIPLTLARQLPREYYKGSDPEWQEFRKAAGDPVKVKKVFNVLLTAMNQVFKQDLRLIRRLGNNVRISKSWLEVQFPDGPPQDYARKGLEIGNGYVAISEEIIPADQEGRIARMLWPSGTLHSLWLYGKTIMVFQWMKVKAAVGMDTTTEVGSQGYKLQHLLKFVQAHHMDKGMGNKQSNPSSPSEHPGVATGINDQPSVAPQIAGRGNSADSNQNESPADRWYMPAVSLGLLGDPAERIVASMVFHATMAQNNRQVAAEPPRGNYIVLGMVRVEGTKAIMLVDVKAHYDPKTTKFSGMQFAVKSIRLRRQNARGGP